MKGVMVDEDCDEFEKLLGEIPNATSVNHFSRQSDLTIHSQELHSVSIVGKVREFPSTNDTAILSYNNLPQLSTNQGMISSNGDAAFSKFAEHQKFKRKINSGFEFPVVVHSEENSNLTDEKSLTLLLEEMNIKENLASKPSSPASVMNNQSPFSLTLLQNEQNENHQNNTLLGYDTTDLSFFPSRKLNGMALSRINLEPQSPVMIRNDLLNPTDRMDGQCNVNSFKSDDVDELKQIPESLLDNISDHQQLYPMSTMAMPMNHCFNSYELLPTAQRVQLPNVYRPNYYVDAQSPPTHMARPGMLWHGMDEERFSRLYQRYLYGQHLHNQRPEVHQAQKSMNFGMRPYNGNTLHQYFELPMPQQLENCNQSLCLNDNTIYDKSEMLEWKDFQGRQIFGVGRQSFPEKILTRSNGLNSIRAPRPNLFTANQPLVFDDNSLKWPNGNAHLPYGLNNGTLHSNNQSYRGSCLDVFYSGLAAKSLQKKYNSVDEISGRILLMAKDQHGCRFLQRKFAEGNQEDIDKIFSEIIFHIVDLMIDPFGNYLVQKLIEVCNEEKMMFILKIITRKNDELIRISCDMHGTRAVQKIIETVQTPEQISIVVSSLAPNIVSVMKHINGNHVAQRCLQYLSKYSKLLVDAAITHCVELATDRQGCCVLQKCLVHSDDDQKKMLIAEISSYSLILSKDQYGNYVVQYVLDLKDPWATAVVLKQLMGNYEHLSVQKYSSNVVEKCLKLTKKDDFSQIIHELLRSPLLSQILQDPYGNYVMQTTLTESKVHEDLHTDLVEAIISHSSTLRSSPYGKKVLSTALLSLKK